MNPYNPPQPSRTKQERKHSIVFTGRLDSHLLQLLLFPALTILGALILTNLVSKNYLEYQLSLFAFVIIWGVVGRLFKRFRPFMLFAGPHPEGDKPKITVVYQKKRITGVMDSAQLSDDLQTMRFSVSKGAKELIVPTDVLGIELSRELVKSVVNLSTCDFSALKREFENAGIASKIHDAPNSHYNIHAGAKFNYNLSSFALLVASISICFVIFRSVV